MDNVQTLLTPKDVQNILQKGRSKVYDLFRTVLVKRGAFKIDGEWRILPNDLIKYINEQKEKQLQEVGELDENEAQSIASGS